MLSCVYDYSHVNLVCRHKIPESHSQKACISTQRFVMSDARCLGVTHVADLHAAREPSHACVPKFCGTQQVITERSSGCSRGVPSSCWGGFGRGWPLPRKRGPRGSTSEAAFFVLRGYNICRDGSQDEQPPTSRVLPALCEFTSRGKQDKLSRTT